MKTFKDLNIQVEVHHFTGDKIKISKVLNREITVFAYKIEDSKFTDKCLHLQIEMNGTKHVLFTGSTYLMIAIQKTVPGDFPFKTTIVENDERYEFT